MRTWHQATGRRPRTKWTMIEMSAMTRRRWTRPPATWKTPMPRSQAISRMTANVASMRHALLGESGHEEGYRRRRSSGIDHSTGLWLSSEGLPCPSLPGRGHCEGTLDCRGDVSLPVGLAVTTAAEELSRLTPFAHHPNARAPAKMKARERRLTVVTVSDVPWYRRPARAGNPSPWPPVDPIPRVPLRSQQQYPWTTARLSPPGDARRPVWPTGSGPSSLGDPGPGQTPTPAHPVDSRSNVSDGRSRVPSSVLVSHWKWASRFPWGTVPEYPSFAYRSIEWIWSEFGARRRLDGRRGDRP